MPCGLAAAPRMYSPVPWELGHPTPASAVPVLLSERQWLCPAQCHALGHAWQTGRLRSRIKACLDIQDHATPCCSARPEDEESQVSLWYQQRVQGQKEGLQQGSGKQGFSSLPARAEGTNKQTDELNCLLNLCISIHITEAASSNSRVLIINAT